MINKISAVNFGNISTNVMEGLGTRHTESNIKPIAQMPISSSTYSAEEEERKAKNNLSRNLVATLVGLLAIATGLYFSKNSALNSLEKNGYGGAQKFSEVSGVGNKAKLLVAKGGEVVETGVNSVVGVFKKDPETVSKL